MRLYCILKYHKCKQIVNRGYAAMPLSSYGRLRDFSDYLGSDRPLRIFRLIWHTLRWEQCI